MERERENILPPDEVCACLDDSGSRTVRVYERCERCRALMESDLPARVEELERERDTYRAALTRERLGTCSVCAEARERMHVAEARVEELERERDEWRDACEAAIENGAGNVDLLHGRVEELQAALQQIASMHSDNGMARASHGSLATAAGIAAAALSRQGDTTQDCEHGYTGDERIGCACDACGPMGDAPEGDTP